MKEVLAKAESKMGKTIARLESDYAAIRAGRANPAVLDKVMVDYYGAPTPVNQLAAVSVAEARVLTIQPWDGSVCRAIERAIQTSDIGINPQSDGKTIRLIFPPLTEEKRKDIVKDVSHMAEEAKIALRSIRRDAMEKLKAMKKDGELTEDEIRAGIRKLTINREAYPVLCGSAFKDKGVQPMLDAVVDYLPSPEDVPSIVGFDPQDESIEIDRKPTTDDPFSALVFKISTHPFYGKLVFVRVYSGSVKPGDTVLDSTKEKKERVGKIFQMHADKENPVDAAEAGNIYTFVGLKNVTTGDTLCDEKAPIILESMEFPEPVIELAIEPKTKAGQGKLGESLAKLAEEDPTFRAHTNQETGQTIIAGMGELHLEIIVDRLLREFKVEANVGAPQVAYKETITKPADIDSKYAKQSGGRGQYGHCKVKFEPMDANGEELYKFESTVVGGAIPKEYIPAVGEGIEEAMKAGILGGFPVVGVHANVYDGSYHEVDSSEMAFHIAGSLAFKDAMQKAAPVLLEPIMKVEVSTPEDYMGDVIGDINSRRGRIEGMEDIGGGKMIRGYVPLSEMFGYATDLRSRTQGRGNYSMFFEKYEQVPKSVQEKILSKKD